MGWFLVLPGTNQFDKLDTVTIFQQQLNVVVYDRAVIVPFSANGQLVIQNYPILFPALYSIYFSLEEDRLRDLITQHRWMLSNTDEPQLRLLLESLLQVENDSSYLGRGSFWQTYEQICQHLLKSNYIQTHPEWNSFFQAISIIFQNKKQIYSNYSVFLAHYYYYLFSTTQEEFYYVLLLMKRHPVDSALEQQFRGYYRKFQHLNLIQMPSTDKINRLLVLKRTLLPLYTQLASSELMAYHYHWQRFVPGLRRLTVPASLFTYRQIHALLESYQYHRLMKTCLLIDQYQKLITLQLIIVLIALVCLVYVGYYLISRSVHRILNFILPLAMFVVVSVFIGYNTIQLNWVANQMMPDKKLSSFDWKQRIEHEFPEMKGLVEESEPEFVSEAPVYNEQFNLLILGKGGITHRDRFTGRSLGEHLTDAILVLSMDLVRKKLRLISIPRDLIYNQQKINSVYNSYGPEKVKSVIRTITGLEIQSYIVLDFMDFKTLIDILGGIEIYVDRDLQDRDWFKITKGVHRLSGDECLKYIRSRRTTSDFDRAYRQQRVMVELFRKINSKQFVQDIFKNKFYSLLYWYSRLETDLDSRHLLTYYQKIKGNFLMSQLVLSSQNCLDSNEDIALGYHLFPKNQNWESVKQEVRRIISQ